MAAQVLDTLGLKCPQPVLKIAVKAPDMKQGDILEILGDCPTFEKDVRTWCERLGKVFLSLKDDGANKKIIQIPPSPKCSESQWIDFMGGSTIEKEYLGHERQVEMLGVFQVQREGMPGLWVK